MSDWRCNKFDYALEVAKGNIPGSTSVNKFGRNIEVDQNITADIWDGGYTVASGGVSLIWVAPTAARIHAIVSTSDEDSETGGAVAQGDGARTIQIYGLTGWDTAEVSETITMDGTTAVNTSNSYVIIHRMKVLTKGGHATGANVGVITATAASDATITAQINVSEGQTQMAIYGVPSTQTAYMYNWWAEANRATASGVVDVDVCVNPEPDAELLNFLTKHTAGLNTSGTSAIQHKYDMPNKFVGPTLIKMQTTSATNNMDVSAGFDLLVVDN